MLREVLVLDGPKIRYHLIFTVSERKKFVYIVRRITLIAKCCSNTETLSLHLATNRLNIAGEDINLMAFARLHLVSQGGNIYSFHILV
jgi:hypothetical protein